jgi:hypothetical protein
MTKLLTTKDYIHILQFYKMKIPKSKKEIQHDAEHIMSSKLCRCIKKLDVDNEARSIGICTRTIFNRKGLTRGKFNCKKNTSVKLLKLGKNTSYNMNKSYKKKSNKSKRNKTERNKSKKNNSKKNKSKKNRK